MTTITLRIADANIEGLIDLPSGEGTPAMVSLYLGQHDAHFVLQPAVADQLRVAVQGLVETATVS